MQRQIALQLVQQELIPLRLRTPAVVTVHAARLLLLIHYQLVRLQETLPSVRDKQHSFVYLRVLQVICGARVKQQIV